GLVALEAELELVAVVQELVYYRDGVISLQTWSFPLWLGWEDFLFPVKEDDGVMPRRIHVRLRRRQEPLADAARSSAPRG
ncbi:MAG: hypothetical protein AAFP22_05250, partial [Planctomycetota bacterium]